MVEFTPTEFSTLMATNFESAFHLSQLAHPLLKSSGEGSVVFTSSVSGLVSLKSMSVHGATKGNEHVSYGCLKGTAVCVMYFNFKE